jgi:type I restriction enzyme S subunit
MINFSTYEKYKDSNLEWLGEIPEGWTLNHLKRYCKNITDGAHTSPDSSSNDFPFLTVVDLKQGELDFENCLYTSKEDYEVLVRNGCNPTVNDVLYSKDGTIGETVVINENKRFVVGSSFIIIKPDTKICVPTYLKYLLASSAMKYQARIYVKGAGLPRISIFNLSKLFLALPSLSSQSAIADYLDEKATQIDERTELLEAKKKQYRELRKTLINEAVTKGLNKTVELKETGVEWLEKIPKHWEVKRNKEIFFEASKKSGTGREMLLTVSHLTGVTPRSEKNVNMFFAESMEDYKICKFGDLLINTMWAWMGALGTSNHEGICSPAYGVYRAKKHIPYNPRYFDYLYRTPNFVVEMTRYSKGIVSSRLRLYSTEFFQIKTAIPPLVEQIQIAKYLDEKTQHLDTIIAKIDEYILALKEFRKTLINDAVMGKIRVA